MSYSRLDLTATQKNVTGVYPTAIGELFLGTLRASTVAAHAGQYRTPT